MGYKRQAKVYNLVFDDAEFAGLEVRVQSLSIGRMREFLRLRNMQAADMEQQADATEKVFDMFADCLLSWNLEDDAGFEVPATREGIDAQDVEFVMSIITAWMETITGVPEETPLPVPSPDGEQSLAASIPMVPLSQSQAS